MEYTKEEKQKARDYLLNFCGIKCGDEIYSVVMKVAPSGMSRQIKFFVAKDKRIIDITPSVARLTDNRLKDYWTLAISGCGMDMCFKVVYDLASVLFPGGDGKYITGRNGDKTPEKDGGYCLKSANLN
jgi:hypothetical protein